LSTDHFVANATGEPNDTGAIIEGERIKKLWYGFGVRWIYIGLGDGRSSVAREHMRMDIEPHLREVALRRAIVFSKKAIEAAVGRHHEFLGYQRKFYRNRARVGKLEVFVCTFPSVEPQEICGIEYDLDAMMAVMRRFKTGLDSLPRAIG
jgi:hypothetical protein